MSKKLGKLIVISAPSGTGKSTLIRMLMPRVPELQFSVSATTRQPREGEINGREYHYISDEEFEKLVQADAFLEHACVYGKWYGTLRSQAEELLSEGIDVMFDIDVQGARQILEAKWEDIEEPEIITILILPPDLETLKKRLLGREGGTNDIDKRMAAAEDELKIGRELFDNHVYNHDGQEGKAAAVEEILGILSDNGIET